MARSQLTPIASSEMSTSVSQLLMTKISTDGVYIKTTGYDATKLVLVVSRSTESTKSASVYVRAGSTAGNEDYEPGAYSTRRDHVITVAKSTGSTKDLRFFLIPETARFKDTDEHINIDFSTALSTGSGSTHACHVGAIYIA